MALMKSARETRRRGPVRRSAQAIVALAAGSDRRRYLADRCRDPRHPAPSAGSFSAPGAGVAGQGAGRRLGRTGRGRDPRLQRATRAGRIPRPDVLIVARGGGSLEDLWSFQRGDRGPRRGESMIPLISAVGHETDITLIDFAADRRAPTPTAAAEMAVPVRSELMVEVSTLARRVMVCWQRGQESRRSELRAAVRALPAPGELLAIPRQRLDGAASALPRALKANTHAHFATSPASVPADGAGTARADRASRPAADGFGRADDPCRKIAVAPSQGPLRRARDPAQGFEAFQCQGTAPVDRA